MDSIVTSPSLLEGIRELAPGAWERFVELYGPLVYGWCRRAKLQEYDAADVVQEVFRSVYRSIQQFDAAGSPGDFRGWLWTVTRNRIVDLHRMENRYPNAIGGSEFRSRLHEIEQSVSQSSLLDESSLLVRAIELIRCEFTESTWQSFWRVAIDNIPTDIVAAELGMSVPAVRQANYRVRHRLRFVLQETPVE